MLLLLTRTQPEIERLRTLFGGNIGRLVQPRQFSGVERTAKAGIPWAADNDCFQGLDPLAFGRLLDRLAPLRETCRFVTVPDVVGDARATAERFELWAGAVARRGLPVALALQDGLEGLPGWLGATWHRLDAVFVGGTTEWKLGPAAAAIVAEAKSRGLWVHVGRVNSLQRARYCRAIGADSIDGTKYARFPDTYARQIRALLDDPAHAGVLT